MKLAVTALKDGGYLVSDDWYKSEDAFLCACSSLQEVYDIIERKFAEAEEVVAANDPS